MARRPSIDPDFPGQDLAPTPGDSYVQSFARGLAVLRSFGAQAPAQTLSEVAARTGLTRAGARRILLTLLQLGYVTADGRQFRLTPKVLELGFAYLASLPLWNQARPALEELSAALRQSCSAALLDGDEIVHVLRVGSDNSSSLSLGIGSRLPAYATAMGRALLCGLAPAQLAARIAAMRLTPLTPHTLTDRPALLGAVEHARQQGWCMVGGELELGLQAIAVPVRDRAGNIIAAIDVSGQANAATTAHLREHCLPQLLATAARVEALLRDHE